MKKVIPAFFIMLLFIEAGAGKMISAQSLCLVDEYRLAYEKAEMLEYKIERFFIEGKIDSLVSLLPLDEREKTMYSKWFSEKSSLSGGLYPDSVRCILPLLGFSADRALIQNGRFEVWLKGKDTTITQFVRFREFVISAGDGGWQPARFINEKAALPPETEILNSEFEVIVDASGENIDVGLTYTIINVSGAPVDMIPLNFRYPMVIREISSGGLMLYGNHRFIDVSGNKVHQCMVNLPSKIEDGDTVKIFFRYGLDYYHHSLNNKLAGISPERGYIVLESGWYPWLNNDFITIPCDIRISVPEKWLGFAPGKLVAENNDNGFKTFHYIETNKSWPFIAWGEYKLFSFSHASSLIEIYLPVNSATDLSRFERMIRVIWEKFGNLLPEPDLPVQRIISVARHGGYGPPGTLLLDETYLDYNKTKEEEITELVAHELSHSWINSLSQPAGLYDHFISEGLSTYLGAMMVEEINGAGAGKEIWKRNLLEYNRIKKMAVPPSDLNDDLMYGQNSVYRGIVYYKGAFFFRLLDKMAGPDKMKQIFRYLLSNDDERLFSMYDIIDATRSVTGIDSTWLFNGYLTTTQLPDYYIKGNGNNSFSNLVLKRTGPDPGIPVDIAAYNNKGEKIEKISLELDSDSVEVDLLSDPSTIAFLVVDPDHYILQDEPLNDIYPDYLVGRADREEISVVIVKAFIALDKKQPEELLELFSGDSNLVTDRMRSAISGAAKSWPYGNIRILDIKFYGTGNGKAICKCDVILEEGGNETRTGVSVELVEQTGWKLINLKFE